MSNAAFSGRERCNEAMRAVRFALRCNGLLDNASFSSPPRLLAALSNNVVHLTQSFGARQLTAMKRGHSQRGGVRIWPGSRTRRSNAAFSGRGNGVAMNHVNCASRAPLQRIVL